MSGRLEPVVATLAEIIHDEHLWECTYSLSCDGTTCATDRARAALAYLLDSGLIRRSAWSANLTGVRHEQ